MQNQTQLQSRLDFIGLDYEARERLASVEGHIEKHLPLALEKFYSKIAKVPAVAKFFDGKPQMDRAQSKQIGHWKAIAAGHFDEAYYQASTRVGLRHAQIGLEPRWHIGGYGVIFETLVRGIVHDMMAEALSPKTGRFGRKIPHSPEAVLERADVVADVLSDVLKSMLLDIDIGVSAYFEKLTSEARAADDAAKAKIDRAVSLTGEVLKDLARGDLSTRITAQFEPEFEQIKADTNAVAEKLTDIVEQLQQTSRSLKTATGEILAGANDLADRTTRQAATIEETTASIEQLSAAVVENATLARTASSKAQAVSSSAKHGGEVMGQANQAMTAIENSSSKISNIIGLIDDIAFQTNLLALNASVEAARAGDAGKGFAVVAVEVRRLAQSAAQASNDVKVLIEASAAEVQSGSVLVGQATETLLGIAAGARESATLIDTIAQANKEQSSALEEVAIAVRQMDEMTQHNAALVEQTNAAIEQTEGQAAELDQIVEVFRVSDRDARNSASNLEKDSTIIQRRLAV
ncbi:methyl-accepting chemotaxis protein [uncultured Devosia sp.]|jgi:methyl-accepting chemotaxis protein|uniref:methyl-accepting chemotaxis protein n=1 Tax=Devosia sp. TaxID=1871048 RepID=UPI0030EB7B7C|tara:strand:- start:27875 stop:29437 length:1563 start_codon:yes stop_codon:yes gene_type:complete